MDPPNTKKISEEYHFEDEENWIRSSNSSPVHSEWSTLFILTIIVGIFVIPADESQGNVSLAQQSSVSDLSHSILFGIDWLSFGKSIIKYVVVMGYLYFTVKFLKNRINWKKLKKL